jgi:sirohydrochlorin ferrochelatase
MQGLNDVRLVPLQLTPAFHAQADIANSVQAMHEAAPGLDITVAPPLGPDPGIIRAALELVERAGYEPEPSTGLVLTAVGSRDPRAVAAVDRTVAEQGAEIAQSAGWGAVRASYLEGGRYITDAATLLHRVDGMRRALCVPFLLTEGVLRDRMETTAQLLGLPMIAGALADTDAMARHVLQRTAQRAAA